MYNSKFFDVDKINEIEKIFNRLNINLQNKPLLILDEKNKNYELYKLKINEKNVYFKIGNITEDRPGQFVTFWKRNSIDNNIIPFNEKDKFDLLLIYVKNKSLITNKIYEGLFIFNKSILVKKKILTTNIQKGKLAIRVFPTWVKDLNKELLNFQKEKKFTDSAKRTQKWQCQYFIKLNKEKFNLDEFYQLLKLR